ncbi:MAG: effector-associated domain EAD1-containing protein [Cyanophyceae cyanobacterium]
MRKWNGERREKFRQAIINCYPTSKKLERLSDLMNVEELNTIAPESGDLGDKAFDLIKWAKRENRLDELFLKVSVSHPDDPKIAELRDGSIVAAPTQKISQQEWDWVLNQFQPGDRAALEVACKAAFLSHYQRSLREVFRDHPSLNDLKSFRQIFSKYDSPELTVAFIDSAIEIITKQTQRNFDELRSWRDNLVRKHNITVPPKLTSLHGYVLVALVRKAKSVQLFAELHLAGQPHPLDSDSDGMRGFSCELPNGKLVDVDKLLANPLYSWLDQAASILLEKEISHQAVLEIFLPRDLLEEQVFEWEALDELQEISKLGDRYRLLVRSLERATHPLLLLKVREGWQRLQKCLTANSVCQEFIEVDFSSSQDTFAGQLISGKVGAKVISGLPDDSVARKEALKQLILSQMPIVLWTHCADFDRDEICEAFDSLLIADNLREVAQLAQSIQEKRLATSANPIQTLGILCDNPDRLPTIPTNERPLYSPDRVAP